MGTLNANLTVVTGASKSTLFKRIQTLVLVALGSFGTASGQSIVNGGFAHTNPLDGPNGNALYYAGVTGWTLSSDSNAGFIELFTPTSGGVGAAYNIVPELTTSIPGGGNMVTFDTEIAAFSNTSLYQTITGLTIGQEYAITFYQAFNQQTNNGYASPVSAYWQVTMTDPLAPTGPALPGQTFLSTEMFADNSVDPILYADWQLQTFNFTASQEDETLNFLSVGEGLPPLLSLANVSIAPVPEPGGAWLIVAAGLFVGLRRRSWKTKRASVGQEQ